MSGGLAPAAGHQLIRRIEAHCVHAWPAEIVQQEPDGWIMRATPGLHGRGRSNHALAPAWPLAAREIDSIFPRVIAFAAEHGIECGMQVGPLEFHIPVLDAAATRGWEIQQSVLVMSADTQAVAASHEDFVLEVSDHVTSEWMAAWELCEPERDNAQAHVDTVFKLMAGRARFCRVGDSAVGIIADYDDLAGLFCLAVNPSIRRQGLGRKLVQALLAQSSAATTYLQVFSANEAGLALYNSLGFVETYRYCHCMATPEVLEAAAQAAAAAAAAAGRGATGVAAAEAAGGPETTREPEAIAADRAQ